MPPILGTRCAQCGQPVANAFCHSRGWIRADEFDVDRRTVQAETLGGEVCGKKKCRVFDYIECTR